MAHMGTTMPKLMGIVLNGVAVPDPSSLSYGLSDISESDAGRDESGIMHPMKLTDSSGNIIHKRQYQLEWTMIDPANAATILQAINNAEKFTVSIFDPLTNTQGSFTMYVGDRSAPFQQWHSGVDGKLYSKISFTLIEV